MASKIGIYTLRIMSPDPPTGDIVVGNWDDVNQAVIDNIGHVLVKAENVINDYLPEGFYCKIDNV